MHERGCAHVLCIQYVSACVSVLFMCVCVYRHFQTVKLSWGTSAVGVILCSEMESFSQHLHNISSQQKNKKNKM